MPDRPAPTISTSKCSVASVMPLSLLSDVMGSREKLQLALSGLPQRYRLYRNLLLNFNCHRLCDRPVKSPGSLRGLVMLWRLPQDDTCNGASCLKSIPVMIRLERAFRLDADILGLVLAQLG